MIHINLMKVEGRPSPAAEPGVSGRPPFTERSSDADIRQAVRNWLLNEPDLAWFPQYNDRIVRPYAIAADEAHKAGFLVFGHIDDAPGATRPTDVGVPRFLPQGCFSVAFYVGKSAAPARHSTPRLFHRSFTHWQI
jgi:hypothetical protein